jgi:hypothetical protein
MKKTAVDYLYEKLYDQTGDNWTPHKILMDAKEIEKSNLLHYGFKCFMLGLSSGIIGMLISKFI